MDEAKCGRTKTRGASRTKDRIGGELQILLRDIVHFSAKWAHHAKEVSVIQTTVQTVGTEYSRLSTLCPLENCETVDFRPAFFASYAPIYRDTSCGVRCVRSFLHFAETHVPTVVFGKGTRTVCAPQHSMRHGISDLGEAFSYLDQRSTDSALNYLYSTDRHHTRSQALAVVGQRIKA